MLFKSSTRADSVGNCPIGIRVLVVRDLIHSIIRVLAVRDLIHLIIRVRGFLEFHVWLGGLTFEGAIKHNEALAYT